MMAKMFYTMDETKAALGKSEDDIKQLVRDSRLREFRDGPRLMFKADAVEALKQELSGDAGISGSGLDGIDLGPSDSGTGIGLADSRGSSGAALSLSDTDQGGSSMGVHLKDDTALAADLGLSGSVGGMPSPARIGSGSGLAAISPSSGSGFAHSTGSGSGLAGMSSGSGLAGVGSGTSGSGLASGSGAAGGSRSGSISVFDTDEVDHADPSAQTSISAASGISDSQLNVEGVGSGSGLLDLTRESDNTSLGAVLDEIGPGTTPRTGESVLGGSRSGSSMSGSQAGGSGRSVISRGMGMVREVEAEDPMAAAFAWASAGAFGALLIATFVLISAVMDIQPKLPEFAKSGMWILFGVGMGLAVVLFVIGMVVGKVMSR